VGGQFKVQTKQSSGSSCDLYKGVNIVTGEPVTVKLERQDSLRPLVSYESKVLKKLKGGPGIPAVHWHGTDGGYTVTVMDHLGPSLQDMRSFTDRKYPRSSVATVADGVMRMIEHMHHKDFIHRDITPSAITLNPDCSIPGVFLNDLGFSKKYRSSTEGHIAFRRNKPFMGTPVYGAVNGLLGIELSRRDDLEAIGYTILDLYCGGLAWDEDEEQNVMIEKKLALMIDPLPSGVPEGFGAYFRYVCGLGFQDQPDYRLARFLLTRAVQESVV